ncbi:MAG: hypothetical protein GX963_05000 [Bacteroidales bacterium]|nr:hypothetical protein [Bacteroidales bacterium]
MKLNVKSSGFRQENLVMVVLSILLTVFYVYEFSQAYLLFFAIVIVCAIRTPAMGFAGWIMSYAYYYNIEELFGIKAHFFLIPLALFSIMMFIVRGKKWSISKGFAVFWFCIFVFSLVAMLHSRDISRSVIPFVLININVFTLISLIAFCKKDPAAIRLINKSIIFSVFSAFSSVLFSSGLAGIGRMGLGGNLRKMANTVSPAVIVTGCQLFFKQHVWGFNTDKPSKLANYVAFAFCVLVLLMTISRGAYLAVAVALAGTFLLAFFWGDVGKRVVRFVLLGIVFLTLLYFSIPIIDDYVLAGRFQRVALSNWGGNPRWEIWMGAISQLRPVEFLFGAGMGTYSDLELLTGHNYYAHSIYVDTLVTVGVPAFIVLVLFMLSSFLRAIKSRVPYSFALILLTTWLYSTHGTLSGSMEFWVLMGIGYASSYAFADRTIVNASKGGVTDDG